MLYTRFQNRDKECFGSSLANYFEFNDQDALAKKVYDGFREHPFVARDGSVSALLCTRLVHDLTFGQYQGTFKYLSFRSHTLESLSKDIGDHAAIALEAIENEIKTGRLVGGLETFDYKGQALVLQSLPTRKLQHWIVDCDDGTVINNGEIRTVVQSQLFFSTINAVLLINQR